jgi:hypothetical protein
MDNCPPRYLAASSQTPVFGLSDLIAAVRSHLPAVVAVIGEELVGIPVAMFERGAGQTATADIVHAIGQTRRTLTRNS